MPAWEVTLASAEWPSAWWGLDKSTQKEQLLVSPVLLPTRFFSPRPQFSPLLFWNHLLVVNTPHLRLSEFLKWHVRISFPSPLPGSRHSRLFSLYLQFLSPPVLSFFYLLPPNCNRVSRPRLFQIHRSQCKFGIIIYLKFLCS